MNARGGERNGNITCSRHFRFKQSAAFRRANTKSGQIIGSGRVDARHFGGFAANQCAFDLDASIRYVSAKRLDLAPSRLRLTFTRRCRPSRVLPGRRLRSSRRGAEKPTTRCCSCRGELHDDAFARSNDFFGGERGPAGARSARSAAGRAEARDSGRGRAVSLQHAGGGAR